MTAWLEGRFPGSEPEPWVAEQDAEADAELLMMPTDVELEAAGQLTLADSDATGAKAA